MEDIKEEIEELIYEYITKNKITVCCPVDVIQSISYDAEEDIKERLWELFKYKINYHRIFEEIERNQDEESDLEEGEIQTDDDSDGE